MRNLNRVIYSGARGWALAATLKAFKRARQQYPPLELKIFIPPPMPPSAVYAFRQMEEETEELLQQTGLSVNGPMKPDEAEKEFSEAAIWCYPAHAPHVEVTAARWAQLCGAIPVYNPINMLYFDVFAGVPLHGNAWFHEMVRMRYAYEMIKLAMHPEYQEQIRVPMMAQALKHKWGTHPVVMGSILELSTKIDGWMTEAELEWLVDAAGPLQDIAEIGSWQGRSTSALLRACHGDVTAVDHWEGGKEEPAHIREAASDDKVFSKFVKNVGHFKHLKIMRMPSVDAAKSLNGTKFDMVFIDGGHGYDEVRQDIKAWLPKANKIICGHDYDWPSVKKAVHDELGNVSVGTGTIWYKLIKEAA